MLCGMPAEMRREALGRAAPGPGPGPIALQRAGFRLLRCYAGLAEARRHLLDEVTSGGAVVEWRHYPEEDAVDDRHGYQWFYHAHPPEETRAAVPAEHGHLHLFARRRTWGRQPAHLLGIGLDARGVPVSLFTVHPCVTGGPLVDAAAAIRLLDRMVLDTGHPAVDTVVRAVVRLHAAELRTLMAARDATLAEYSATAKPEAVNGAEPPALLSCLRLDLDARLASLCRPPARRHGGAADRRSRKSPARAAP